VGSVNSWKDKEGGKKKGGIERYSHAKYKTIITRRCDNHKMLISEPRTQNKMFENDVEQISKANTKQGKRNERVTHLIEERNTTC